MEALDFVLAALSLVLALVAVGFYGEMRQLRRDCDAWQELAEMREKTISKLRRENDALNRDNRELLGKAQKRGPNGKFVKKSTPKS